MTSGVVLDSWGTEAAVVGEIEEVDKSPLTAFPGQALRVVMSEAPQLAPLEASTTVRELVFV